MKKTFIIAVAALLMGATNTFASTTQKDVVPMDTIRAYFIDGEHVKNFTGKELVGKTIKSYDINPSTYDNMDGKGACHVLLLHDIKTDKATPKPKPLVFIDGIMDANGLNAVKPADIVSMTVIKDPKILKIYSDMGLKDSALANGVVRIVTKKQKTDPIVYLVDGAEMTYNEVLKIPSDKIKSMNVYKRGNDHKYTAKYGKKIDVVEINLK